jgi:Tfp pilus assembly protein FimT
MGHRGHSTWTTKILWTITMGMQNSKAKANTQRTGDGFSIIELLITATVLTIVTGLGLMGISRARASVRLSGSAREYASYIEKARVSSIRRHADDAAERAAVAISDDRSSYNVMMDLDGDGGLDTRTVTLPEGITFGTTEAIAFDWRGRTLSTVGGVTSPNAQVSIRLQSNDESVSVDVTGSGDITIDSKVFDDSVPRVNLNVGDLASGATPVSTPVSVTPTPTPNVVGTPDQGATPGPTPIPVDSNGNPLPTPTPSATPTPSPTATPTPTPSATPRATPTPPSVCTISTDALTLILHADGSKTIKVSHNASTSVTITGTSSKPSDLQVTPGGAQAVGAGAVTTFTVKSKKSIGAYTVTFSSNCGSKTVPVVVLL